MAKGFIMCKDPLDLYFFIFLEKHKKNDNKHFKECICS
jgi:hypothetical protein